jgi:hypothetical protein
LFQIKNPKIDEKEEKIAREKKGKKLRMNLNLLKSELKIN